MTTEPIADDDQPTPTESTADRGTEASEGPSGFGNAETAAGGADAVPDTPDVVPGTPN